MFKAAFGGRPVSNVRPAAAPQAREQTQRPLSRTAMRPMRTRPDYPSAAISRSSPSLRQHTIDARLDSWITPNDKFFGVGHYEWPAIDAATWRLDVAGQVGAPLGYTLNDLKTRPRQEVTFTLECSGNNGLPFLTSAIGNAKWAGTSLANILEAAKIKGGAKEVVFFGADRGDEVLRPGTPLELKFTENFARSMSIDDAMNPANILCYEMNGEPLPAHVAPPCAPWARLSSCSMRATRPLKLIRSLRCARCPRARSPASPVRRLYHQGRP